MDRRALEQTILINPAITIRVFFTNVRPRDRQIRLNRAGRHPALQDVLSWNTQKLADTSDYVYTTSNSWET